MTIVWCDDSCEVFILWLASGKYFMDIGENVIKSESLCCVCVYL